MIKNKDKIIKAAVSAFLAMAAAQDFAADTKTEDQSSQNTEKCYGVVKAGMNDCATATASCAGSSTKDNQPDAFVFVSKGLCEKLVGGSLSAGTEKKS
ncbi:signal peptide protein [Legionella maceachernii]|uniref:Signal peptide protein n=1 Tax=Legionella maceachernii TaxID=466 RepID=A0A0W0WBV1_9GAMM|nr:signal peptide protein [Legionella maceachernii]SJZ78680.1 Uncharacterized membrane protein [Legionella maceachernii]SUP02960.1 Predicted integral membrane protein [Legionella maceachernii]